MQLVTLYNKLDKAHYEYLNIFILFYIFIVLYTIRSTEKDAKNTRRCHICR